MNLYEGASVLFQIERWRAFGWFGLLPKRAGGDASGTGLGRMLAHGHTYAFVRQSALHSFAAARVYFFAAAFSAAAFSYFLLKRSTRPAVSSSFCLPVKNGWQLEQISTFRSWPFIVERVWKVLPQAQCTVTS
jgi:hypothetical protein